MCDEKPVFEKEEYLWDKRRTKKVYRSSVALLSTVKYWITVFKCSCTNIFNEELPGRLIEVTTSELVEKNTILW